MRLTFIIIITLTIAASLVYLFISSPAPFNLLSRATVTALEKFWPFFSWNIPEAFKTYIHLWLVKKFHLPSGHECTSQQGNYRLACIYASIMCTSLLCHCIQNCSLSFLHVLAHLAGVWTIEYRNRNIDHHLNSCQVIIVSFRSIQW